MENNENNIYKVSFTDERIANIIDKYFSLATKRIDNKKPLLSLDAFEPSVVIKNKFIEWFFTTTEKETWDLHLKPNVSSDIEKYYKTKYIPMLVRDSMNTGDRFFYTKSSLSAFGDIDFMMTRILSHARFSSFYEAFVRYQIATGENLSIIIISILKEELLKAAHSIIAIAARLRLIATYMKHDYGYYPCMADYLIYESTLSDKKKITDLMSVNSEIDINQYATLKACIDFEKKFAPNSYGVVGSEEYSSALYQVKIDATILLFKTAVLLWSRASTSKELHDPMGLIVNNAYTYLKKTMVKIKTKDKEDSKSIGDATEFYDKVFAIGLVGNLIHLESKSDNDEEIPVVSIISFSNRL